MDQSAGRDPATDAAGHAHDVTDELARLLPELAVALYESTPHHKRGERPAAAEPLTGRQLEAVVFLSHHRKVTMGEFAGGLDISRAAASELVARLVERDVVRRETRPGRPARRARPSRRSRPSATPT